MNRVRIKRDKEVIGDVEVLRKIVGKRIREDRLSVSIDGIWCG